MSRSLDVDPEKTAGHPQGDGHEPLDVRIRMARDSMEQRASRTDVTARNAGIGFAMRIGTELVAALAVGVGIGYALDRWLGTGPWLLVLFFFLGAAAGIVNVWRVASGQDSAVGYRRAAASAGKPDARKAGDRDG